jgi:hypothetical protein
MDNLSHSLKNTRTPLVDLLLFLASAFGFMTVFSFLGMAIIYYFFGITNFDFSNPENILPAKILQFFNAMGLFIIPPVFYYQVIKKESITGIFSHKVNPILLLLATILIYLAMPTIEWLAELNKLLPVPENWQDFFKQLETQNRQATKAMLLMTGVGDFLFSVLIIGILPALGEEMFFRGVLQRIFIRWSNNIWTGVCITAFIFSALHLDFSGFLPRFFLGVILGLLYVWSGNLWYSVLVHFLNNTTVVIYIYVMNINVEQLEDFEMMQSVNWYGGLISLIACTGILFYFYKIAKQPQNV